MFETINAVSGSGRAGWEKTILASLLVHSLIIGTLVVVPLVYFETIPSWDVITVFAGVRAPDPVPPVPPQPAPPKSSGPTLGTDRPIVVTLEELVEPPQRQVPLPPDAIEVTGAIWQNLKDLPRGPETGIPGGYIGPGERGSNLQLSPPVRVVPPPPPRTDREPIKISVLEPSRLIHRVEPVYPELALRTRVQGAVMLRVTVDESGIVQEVEVVSGHPLLQQAAVEAVRQWRYKPIILNGEPVAVNAAVTVNFFLTRR